MRRIKALFAALVLVPLLATGASLDTAEGLRAPTETPRVTAPAQYQCCWIYWMGQWQCVPC